MQRGRSVLFTTCSLLVQQLLIAKRELLLPKMITKLSRHDALIVDDLAMSSRAARRWRFSSRCLPSATNGAV